MPCIISIQAPARAATSSWQLNAGFTFDEDHSESYGAAIENYISSVEQFAKDKGYEVHLAASLLFGEDSGEIDGVDEFFRGVQGELERIGGKLSSYLTKAMKDGITDIEDAEIQNYLQKMNEITEKLTQAQAQAKIDTMKNRYDGTDLDVESFIALQEDVGGYIQEIIEGAEAAYESSMTQYRYRQMTDESYTDEMFAADQKKAKLAELDLESGAVLEGLSFTNDAITTQYKDKFETYCSDISAMVEETFSSIEYGEPAAKAMSSLVEGLMSDGNVSAEARGALAELYEQLKPNAEQLEQIAEKYRQAGAEVPQSILDGINEIAQIGAISGDYDAAWRVIADSVANNQEYQGIIDQMAENGYIFDEVFATEIKNNTALINNEIRDLHTDVQSYIDTTFADGFDASAEVRLTLNPSITSAISGKSEKSGIDWSSIWNNLPHNAEGGIYDKPLITTFAEEGPEAAIPLDGSTRAKELLMEAADRLGILGSGREQSAADSFTTRTADQSNSTMLRRTAYTQEALEALVPDTSKRAKGVLAETADRLGSFETGKVQSVADSLAGGTTSNHSESHSTTIPIYYSPQITIMGSASQGDVASALSINMEELRVMIEEINAEKARVSFAY